MKTVVKYIHHPHYGMGDGVEREVDKIVKMRIKALLKDAALYVMGWGGKSKVYAAFGELQEHYICRDLRGCILDICEWGDDPDELATISKTLEKCINNLREKERELRLKEER